MAALFVASQAQAWGNVDQASGEIDCHLERQEADEDLLELAAIDTLEHGGDIFASDGDQTQLGSPVAAVFRY